MARRKRQNPLLAVAQTYLNQNMPEMRNAVINLRMLDGPPGSPRFAATAELCTTNVCPHGVPIAISSAGHCPVIDCPLRHSVRLLLDRRGGVVETISSGIHWT
ncbi:MAG: hypothetical protein IPO81_22300 [Kouleothrix sp.]|nr:hypothetical protein [Kouleothrix sp.]